MQVNVLTYDDELCSNIIIIGNDKGHCVIIDPSKNDDRLLKRISSQYVNVDAVFITHGHIDHIRGIDLLYEKYHCPIYIHQDDISMLDNVHQNCSAVFGKAQEISSPVIDINDGQILTIPDFFDVEVIHTPFHTKGSCCFYIKDLSILLSGDTLLKRGVGRTDLPHSESKSIDNSLRKLVDLYKNDGDMKVIPGHGPSTTLKDEMLYNSYLFRIK